MSESDSVKLEFACQVKNPGDLDQIRDALKKEDLGKIVELQTDGRLIIDTKKPWTEIQAAIESTDRRAVLTGSGGVAAVAICDQGDSKIKGVVRFCANSKTEAGSVVDGVLDGLESNKKNYKLSIREFGDISCACESLGGIFKGHSYDVNSDENGRAVFRFHDEKLRVTDLIGRSVLISNDSKKLSCGIIARSAGIFENFKRICACDGVKIWDERDVPLTGPGRRINSNS